MGNKATRAAFGETLNELVADGYDVVAVEADLSKSTTTVTFQDAHPDRFFNAGIAEANMIDVAAGLAVTGKVAFTGSFAVFATGRAYDQVRNTVCYSDLNVKLAPTHSGITVGPDGGSHQMVEDLALMRVLPGMRVLVPADYNSAKSALRLAAAIPGPFYVRLGRASVPEVYAPDFEMELGRAYVLREGSDVTLFACGVMVVEALQAAESLAAEGISAEVIDIASVKPLDAEMIVASARKTGHVVTCEEHSIIGGMGSAVAELLGETCPVPMRRVGVRDVFGTSGDPDELMAHFGLTASDIVVSARNVLA
ncbi:MAG: transketolase family protein [Coriobacteriia bacterium]|nr:transketolase family protein [Coriobacteriia bacterium]MBN2823639.1 transketolase family protein [Coriobacteriia bacterium]